MRTLVTLCGLLLAVSAHGYEHWNDIRHSAALPDTTVVVRVENPSGAGVENYLLYAGAGVVETAMSPVIDGPMTVSAAAPGPSVATAYYGFRLVQGSELDLVPVKLPSGSSPQPDDLTRIAEDPLGDEIFGREHLDIVDCRVSFSDTELHGSITNAGGGFPVNQLLTFFSYLIAIADPEAADPDTVFALIQTYEQAGIISPGLYKVTGPTTGDLLKIGEIDVEEFSGQNTLMLTCQLDDLMADPYFQSWYDPSDPRIGVAGFTQRITILGGAADADTSPGGTVHLREFAIEPGPNTLPVLSDAAFVGDGATSAAEIDYLDADAHCPVVSEIVFDGAETFLLYPQDTDYAGEVRYRSDEGIGPLAGDTWQSAVFRFSDNQTDVVEHSETNTGAPEGTSLALAVSPNPVRGAATIALTLPASGHIDVAVYDVRGARVATLADRSAGPGAVTLGWDGRDSSGRQAASGVYFLKVATPRSVELRKFAVVR